MRGSKHITAVMVIALLAVAMVPATVGAAAAEQSLTLGVTQDTETGNATVTVTQNDSVVENATVEVESSANYTGTGTYQTDANGTVELPNPEERVNVTLNASADNATASESVELVPLDKSLRVAVEHDDANDSVTATVRQYGEPVENATVEVTGSDYENGTFQTDANGTVSVAEPDTTTNLTFLATSGDLSVDRTVEITADEFGVSVTQGDDASVTVSVTEDDEGVENATVVVSGNYTDAGEYQTDENGTVELSAPLQNTTVNVTATYENDTAETTATLLGEVADDSPFGELVSRFVERLKTMDYDGPMGQAVSDFVTENNPGNADEKRPDHAGPKDDKADKHEDKERGPPEHAQKDKGDEKAEKTDDDSDDSDEAESDDDDDDDDDKKGNSNGKPDHAKGK
ncbi:hypothetical protein ACFQJC_00005 [Haloferax namakaokahaiae]|uniref:DNA primase n=1 Tax=Haloferax namakaokahaiae TaxID=1748331 RepID=A0ABD5Z9P5_9EURY